MHSKDITISWKVSYYCKGGISSKNGEDLSKQVDLATFSKTGKNRGLKSSINRETHYLLGKVDKYA